MSIIDYPNGSTNVNALVLTDNSTQLQVTSGAATQSGVISETGGSFGLEKIGSGTLIYTGANTYTGLTTISGGTLQIGNNGPASSIEYDILDDGVLAFSNLDSLVFGAISGTGSVVILSGTAAFIAVNSYTGGTTINSGAALEIDGTAGIMTGNIANNGTFTPMEEFDGAISGSGVVHIRGSFFSPIILGGVSTYTGATQLDQNAYLVVTGSIANSTINLPALAQLGGTGTVGTTTVGSNSGLTPGVGPGAIGTLSIAGDLTIASGGYAVDLVPGYADKVQVSGATTIAPDSGLSIAVAANVTYAPGVYTLLSSVGNLSGHFSYVNYSYYGNFSPGIVPFISYDAHNVFLTLSQEKTWSSSPGTNLFTSTANWANSTAPGSGETAVFGGSSITTIAVNGPVTIGGMRFAGPAPRYTFNVAGDLTINNQGITDPLYSFPSFNVANGSSLTFTGFATSGTAVIDVAQGGVLFYAGAADPGTSLIDGPNGVMDIGGIDRTTFGFNRLGTIGTIDLGGKTLLVIGGATVSANIVDNSLSNGSHPSGVRITGGGVRFTGTSTYTGGTTIDSNADLRLGNNGNTGSISGDVANAGLLSFERSDTVSYGGVVSGTGRVSQFGSGTTILGATNTYTGVTTVDGGTLLVDGAIASSAVTVASSATLGGSGTVGTTSIQAGGTLAPGDGIGTLQVNGNLILASGANYTEELSPGAADKALVSGSANINGSLTASFSAGSYTPGTQYTLLSATGPLNGQFNNIQVNGLPANLRAIIKYGAHDVTLTVASRAPFDADDSGTSDLVWQNTGGQAVVWLMNGTTVLSQAAVGSNPGPSWHVKTTGDFDGDGNADIVWQNDSGQAQIWFLNGASIVSNQPAGSNPGPTWHIIATGDFDANGRSDILWQSDSGQAAIWLMNGSTVSSSAAVGGNPGTSWHVKATGDFDGDGKSDILWQNDSGQAAIWLMNGTTVTGGTAISTNPGNSWHIKGTGDFDGDFKSDILWQNDNGQVQIWLMNGTTVSSTTIIGTNPGANWRIKGTADLNGDGKSDILWQSTGGQAMAWLMNGTTIASTALLGSNPGPNWQIANYGTTPRKTANDFDGDHNADLLWQSDSGQAALWFMNGTSMVSGAAVGSNPGASWHVKGAGDFDGDGKADILWQNDNGQAALWLMNGSTIANGAAFANNPGPSWHVIGAGDFDGDGKADILWQNDSGQAAIWFMNGVNFTSGAVVSSNPGSSWHIKGAGDFDGDGKADILFQTDTGQAAIWLMNGANVSSGPLVGSNPGTSWHIKAAADFDGDGQADILWQNDNGQAAIWLMNGTTVANTALVGSNPGPSWQVTGAADINGDGMADILWQNTNGQAAAWLMSGTNVLSSAAVGSNPGTGWHLIANSG